MVQINCFGLDFQTKNLHLGPFDTPKHFKVIVPQGFNGHKDPSGVSILLFLKPIQIESAYFDIAEHRCDNFGLGKHFLHQPDTSEIFAKVVTGMSYTLIINNADPL